ncbi:bifunctional demethylmenaquinone methyltransferase/2-methoxy-6-polyprenyl-1,4-benzoquinol methylase UbiE [Leptolyngbya cf. ectocarpi LEGE 11479]|uniref:2-phytyl-1,4-naphtoquinone methyltransferase n=1 Tax=Leptolyngbya cf. ectocarpi LEGE 11479 TaxID=1828722 RepID=A0A929FBU3_LEPEC|nr:bifunctional demethylmenaquinone methyltransferase/2-methoxy-6-polyprenyl-1,4-benzoquinol methylase UbiE [Leptolyngbya ectocarpi]MBE9069442.1 bifunctional demethylmenaquinone methyltransferase/2-methoxy-6-polyprenyl-1,4-benzoquinol methylase UbiE [Leptolyngbya cf. ectocarpi LEGE 11479]
MAQSPHDAKPNANDIRDLFDRIAPVYDELNQSLSFGLHRIWKQMAVDWSGAQPGMNVLDVCCGSGDLALLLARQVGSQGQVTGADFAVAQLAIAAQRAADKGYSQRTQWVEADALSLPFKSDCYDALTMGYGLRNLTDIPQGLRELHRVLKPGAKAAVLDFHQPSSELAKRFQQWYLDTIVVPAAERCGLTEEYAYIGPSVDRFPSGHEQRHLAQAAGFSKAIHYPLAGGMMGVLVAQK